MLDDLLRTLLSTLAAVYTFTVIDTRNIVDNGDRVMLARLFT